MSCFFFVFTFYISWYDFPHHFDLSFSFHLSLSFYLLTVYLSICYVGGIFQNFSLSLSYSLSHPLHSLLRIPNKIITACLSPGMLILTLSVFVHLTSRHVTPTISPFLLVMNFSYSPSHSLSCSSSQAISASSSSVLPSSVYPMPF